MPDWLTNAFPRSDEISLPVLVVRLVVALVAGMAVGFVYTATHKKDDAYQPSFVTTLVLLCVLIAVVTQVVGQNVARAFSLVGALAIVRFRTVVADTRDTAFVIFSVVVGMAIGAGHVAVGAAGLVVAGSAAFLFRPRARPPAGAWRLTVRLAIGQDQAGVEAVIGRRSSARDLVGVVTARQGSALELSYALRLPASTAPAALVAELNATEGVQQTELTRL